MNRRADLAAAVAVAPAAGQAFLGPMIEQLVDSCRRLGKQISASQNSLIAYELDETSAERARVLAANVLMERNVPRSAEKLASGWVRTDDYLFEAPDVAADFVIGNPPYVRPEEIP